MSEKRIGIYGLRNTVNGKWYVGQSAISIGERWNRYRLCRCKNQRKLYHALLKYGYDAFEKVVLEECGPEKEILGKREEYWSNYYNSVENGYNISPPGEQPRQSEESKRILREKSIGRKHSEETKRKMRENHNYCERPRSLETTEKLRKALTGKKRSPEVCEKMKKSFIGRPGRKKSGEEKEKIRLALLGRSHSKESRQKMRDAAASRYSTKVVGPTDVPIRNPRFMRPMLCGL